MKLNIRRISNIGRMSLVRDESKIRMGMDWNEFIKLYEFKRQAYVFSKNIYDSIVLYCAMKMAFENKKIILNVRNHWIYKDIKEIYYAIVRPSDRQEPMSMIIHNNLYFPRGNEHVEFIHPGTFGELDWKSANEYAKSNYFEKSIIFSNDCIEMNDDFDDSRSLKIEYSKEKKTIDNWIEDGNSTFIDPMFEMLLMDKSIDKHKMFRYMATNFKYQFREYFKFDKEFILKYMPRKELIEYGIVS